LHLVEAGKVGQIEMLADRIETLGIGVKAAYS
jgi:hypothetical protein